MFVLPPHLKGESDVVKNSAVRQQAKTLKANDGATFVYMFILKGGSNRVKNNDKKKL